MEAKVEGVQGRLSTTQYTEMLQALPEDRFQLKVRNETKEMPIFALMIAEGGSKLTPHIGGPPGPGNRNRMSSGTLSAKQGGTAGLAGMPQRELWRPVIDKTGLREEYDFTLTWVPEPGQEGPESLGLPPRADDAPPPLWTDLRSSRLCKNSLACASNHKKVRSR